MESDVVARCHARKMAEWLAPIVIYRIHSPLNRNNENQMSIIIFDSSNKCDHILNTEETACY